MSDGLPLSGLRVLVTRPAAQAAALCQAIGDDGGSALSFPLLGIEPLDQPRLPHVAAHLRHYHLAVFISANAVWHGLPPLLAAHPVWPPHLRLAAVGRATACALAAYPLPPPLQPAADFSGHGLLQLPEFQAAAVRGRRVLICRGQGGRELLADSLRERGAHVEYLEVYRRVVPTVDWARHPWAERGELDLIIVSSGEALRNLYHLLSAKPWLPDLPLLVVSPRLAELARELGARRPPVVAASADDDAVLDALRAWVAAHRGT